jgi:DNA-binding transcriptional regulator YiaG
VTPDQIRTWREAHNLTQAQLGDWLGVHQVAVARWEAGVRTPASFLQLALERLEHILAERAADEQVRPEGGRR